MTDQALAQALPRALLVLRITLGLFLLQWGVEKFVVPENTVAIWSHFYGLNVSQALGYLFGAVEIAIAGCIFFGQFRTTAYGAALGLHTVSVLVSWRQRAPDCREVLARLRITVHSFAGVPSSIEGRRACSSKV